MPEILKNISEHASVIILILAAFSAWSMKRILGKLESSLEELKTGQEKRVEKVDLIHKDIYEKHNKLAEEFHQLLGEHHATHKKGGQ